MESNSNCTLQGSKIQLEMVKEFQCPGCINGSDPETCPKYELGVDDKGGNPYFFACKNWRPSTFMGGVGRLCLGLPKGFLRTGMVEFHDKPFTYLRLYENPTTMPEYDRFNIPVWAMEKDGHLFVRCFSPRNCWIFVDVIKDGKLEHASYKEGELTYKAINVGEFYDEID